jgi:hypothetical protein
VPANEVLPGGRFSPIKLPARCRGGAGCCPPLRYGRPGCHNPTIRPDARSDRCAGGQASGGASSRRASRGFGGQFATPAENGIGFGEGARFALQALSVPNACQFSAGVVQPTWTAVNPVAIVPPKDGFPAARRSFGSRRSPLNNPIIPALSRALPAAVVFHFHHKGVVPRRIRGF